MTSAEASALGGTTFGAGVESTTGGGGRICTYGGRTTNVFEVVVAQAPDATTANNEWTQDEAQAETELLSQVPANVPKPILADATGLGDRAAIASASVPIQGQTINLGAIYILKGLTFFSFSDLVLNKPGPTLPNIYAQAKASLTRIP